MGVKRYIVVDSLGNYLKSFTTYQLEELITTK